MIERVYQFQVEHDLLVSLRGHLADQLVVASLELKAALARKGGVSRGAAERKLKRC